MSLGRLRLGGLAAAPPACLPEMLFHGTPSTAAAQMIRANGLRGAQVQGRHFMAPVAGRVYMTPSLPYAVIYALGGDVAGSNYVARSAELDPFGYVFGVPTATLRDVQPDEDSIGEMVSLALQTEEVRQKYYAGKEAPAWLASVAQRVLTPRQLIYVKGGEYIYFAAAGKKLVKLLSDAQKQDLLCRGAHVASAGVAWPTVCWRIDKRRGRELKRDSSNFFDVAERCA